MLCFDYMMIDHHVVEDIDNDDVGSDGDDAKEEAFQISPPLAFAYITDFCTKGQRIFAKQRKTGKEDKFAEIEVGGLITWQKKFLPRPRN